MLDSVKKKKQWSNPFLIFCCVTEHLNPKLNTKLPPDRHLQIKSTISISLQVMNQPADLHVPNPCGTLWSIQTYCTYCSQWVFLHDWGLVFFTFFFNSCHLYIVKKYIKYKEKFYRFLQVKNTIQCFSLQRYLQISVWLLVVIQLSTQMWVGVA